MNIGEVTFWIAFPFRVAWGLIRDEIEFWKIVHHHATSKPFKDIEE
jgi:hypothetical protein